MLLSLGDREQQMLSFTYFYFFFFFKFLNQAVKDSNDDKDPGGGALHPSAPSAFLPQKEGEASPPSSWGWSTSSTPPTCNPTCFSRR